MPLKREKSQLAPLPVLEHLKYWGNEIRYARIRQRTTAVRLAEIIGVSHPTIGRMEKGDAAVAIASYFFALYYLGLIPRLAPEPDGEDRFAESTKKRAVRDTLADELGYF